MGFLDVLDLAKEPAHTKLLAWLLDPNEDHGLGSAVLERFCTLAVGHKIHVAGAVVSAETREATSRPDITITTAEFYIAVEIKIRDDASSPEQLNRHTASIQTHCEHWNHRPHLVLLIPDKNRDGAADFPRDGGDCSRQRLDWHDIVRVLREAASDETVAASQGAVFIPFYVDFVEREVLYMWKGFDPKLLNAETLRATATLFPKIEALNEHLTLFAEAVRMQLPENRRRILAKVATFDDWDAQAGAPYLFSYKFRLNATDALWLTFYVAVGPRSREDLRLCIDFTSESKQVIGAARQAGWLDAKKSRQLFGSSADPNDLDNWMALTVTIPNDVWWTETGTATNAAVLATAKQLIQIWDAYDNLIRPSKQPPVPARR